MVETLEKMIHSYKNNFVKTPNLQIIKKTFSDEIIADLTLSSSTFKESCLTNIKFTNVNFESSFFEDCLLENCSFNSTNFNSIECENSTLKNCQMINCDLSDTNFTETIFERCLFQRIEKASLGEAWFESCHFIKTIFNGFDAGQIGSAVQINSKFSNSKKSIEFKRDFYLLDVLQPLNGILLEENSLNQK